MVKFCADIGITVFGDELVKEGGSNIGGGKDGSGSAAVLGKRKRGSGRTGGESGFTGVRVNEASARLNYWVSAGLIPKWYTYGLPSFAPHPLTQNLLPLTRPPSHSSAITSLTATPSFTPLSLTLLSLFTRLLHLTHALPIFTAHASFLRNTRQLLAAEEAEKKEREEEDEVVRVLEAFGREMVAEQVEEVGIRVERGGGGGGVVGQGWGGSLGRGDGEKVSRERRAEGGAGVGIMQDSKMTETTAPQAPQPQPPKKKKKKKPANAIDALFAGL